LDALHALAEGLHGEPAALGLSGQMHGILLAGESNAPLTPLISWQDRRANENAPDGRSYLARFLDRCPPEALERSGCRPAPGYGGVTLYTLRERGELPAGAWRALTVADWIGAKLAAAEPAIDPSNAAALGLFDIPAGAWSEALLDAAMLDPSRLPAVAAGGSRLGEVRADIAAETGLPPGLPVITAIGDNQAAVLGSLPSGAEALQINIGTGGQINWTVARFLRVEGMDTRPLPIDRLMLTGAGVSGGDAYAWVERAVSSWLGAFGEAPEPDAIYARLAELAAELPEDNDGLSSRPVFRGTRRRPAERGVFQGVSFDNFTPGHVARAVLDGIARGLHEFLVAAETDSPRADRIIATGNAVRRNPLLALALERRFGLPVWTPVHEEEAAYGAALLAGTAAGMWRSLDEAGLVMQLRPALGNEPVWPPSRD
jgi:sugar (pentulose or hexulose) kinase